MRIKFDTDDGQRILNEAEESAPSRVDSSSLASPVSSFSELGRQRVEELILLSMQGRLPRERALEVWEPQKLHARHIAMLLDRAGGCTPKELSMKFRMSQVHVNNILKHPDSQKILSAMQASAADKQTDVSSRLQGYANAMLDVKIELVRTTKDNRLKDSIASDLLDRAGYGPRRQIDVTAKGRFAVPVEMAMAMSGALAESDRVADIDYSQFTGKRLTNNAPALESGEAVVSTPISEGSIEPEPVSVEASLDNSPAELRKFA